MRCFIYRNLHKDGCVYSIKALEGVYKGRIIGYASGVIVNDVVFKVSEAGRERVRREKKKNVHAGIVGNVVMVSHYKRRLTTLKRSEKIHKFPFSPLTQVTYNPYLYDTFVKKKNGQPVLTAAQVIIRGTAVAAIGVNLPIISR